MSARWEVQSLADWERAGREGMLSVVIPAHNEAGHIEATLRSLTEGRGIHTEEFSHYEEMPKDMEQKVIAAAQKEKEEA